MAAGLAAECTTYGAQDEFAPADQGALVGAWTAIEVEGRPLRHGGFTLVFESDWTCGGRSPATASKGNTGSAAA